MTNRYFDTLRFFRYRRLLRATSSSTNPGSPPATSPA
ncbi:hypothetical protein PHLH8_40270 [Pseudomonas sp. Pc102]|nr:hypothetical protein PHLH8_40270 [Pseudomonas sp. Pc102]